MNARLAVYALSVEHLPWLRAASLKFCLSNAKEFTTYVAVELSNSTFLGYGIQLIFLLKLMPEGVLASNKILSSMLQRIRVDTPSVKEKLTLCSEVLLVCGGWRQVNSTRESSHQ